MVSSREANRISAQIERYRALIADREVGAPHISQWPIGMHIHHCALSMSRISRALIECRQSMPRGAPNLTRAAIFATGRIPRGRAKAPKQAWPEESPNIDLLTRALDDAASDVRKASGGSDGVWFEHFALGIMNKNAAFKFMRIHNSHHLAIIRDIIRQGPSNRSS